MTPKQQRFVQEYIVDLNGTQAAIRAGYSEHTAQEQSSRLLSKAMISDAVKEAMAKKALRLEITADKVLRDLEMTREMALRDGDYGPAIRAAELQGKHIGMFVDRSETTLKDERMVVNAPQPEQDADEWANKNRPH